MIRHDRDISPPKARFEKTGHDESSSSRSSSLTRGCLPFLLVALFASSACGGASTPAPQAPSPPEPAKPAPAPPPPAAVVSPPVEKETLPFVASGSGPTEGQAYEQAKQRLLVALMDEEAFLTPDRFTADLGQAVHVKDTDFFEATSQNDGFVVKIGLSKESLPNVFSRLQSALVETEVTGVPEQLTESIQEFRRARFSHDLCLRQKKLLEESECEPVDLGPPKRQLQMLLRKIEIASIYDGGIPSTEEAFLRPLSLEVTLAGRRNEKLENLPLLLSWPEQTEPVVVSTDRSGTIRYSIPEDLNTKTKFTVTLNESALFGHQPERLAPETQLALGARPIGLARSAWVLQRADTASELAKKAAQQRLRTLLNQPTSLDKNDAKRVQGKSGPSLGRVLSEIADEKKGELDTVLLLDAQSEFASRMGTHRVWYEARGKLTALNAWTGEVLAEVSALVTESGVGESRAEKAARESLGEELASKLRRELDDRNKPTVQAAR